jgi:hypothetical protein
LLLSHASGTLISLSSASTLSAASTTVLITLVWSKHRGYCRFRYNVAIPVVLGTAKK